MYDTKSLCTLVREAESLDINGSTTISKYVTQSMRADIDRTEAYYNSQFTSGATDADGRPKPFKNICKPAVNIWYRATSRTPNSLYFRATSQDQQITALLATIKLHEWFSKVNFGEFLNDWGYALAKHGSSIVEFVEKNGELIWRVLDWNNLIVDPIDFENNIKIKKLWLTPAQLKKNENYDQEMVEELLENLTTRKTISGTTKDSKQNYIELYEVHGELPLFYLTNKEEDKDTFVQQMHVLTFVEKKEGEYDDYSLFKGREKQDPMMITHLIKKEGQTYTGGAVYNLFEAQWMINDSEKMIRDQLLLCSKVFFQGSDESMAGANFFSNIDNGEYLFHKPNEPMTRVGSSPDIVPMQSWRNDWQSYGNTANGIADAMVQQAKSGTAWRQTQAELQEAHSLFEKFGQTKDLYLKEMVKKFILPFFKKQLKGDTSAISKILEAHEIKQIDERYLSAETTRRVNQKIKDTILNGEVYDPSQQPQDMAQMGQQVQSELQGNQRFILPAKVDWAKELEELDWDNLELVTESDSQDIQNQMATFQTALQFLISLQGRPMNEEEQMIFNNLVSLTGTISPLQLNQSPAKVGAVQQPNQPQPATQMPAMAGG